MKWKVKVHNMVNSSVNGAEGMYIRVRGTNLPQGTPNETDADGNPLRDDLSENIPCPFVSSGEDPKSGSRNRMGSELHRPAPPSTTGRYSRYWYGMGGTFFRDEIVGHMQRFVEIEFGQIGEAILPIAAP